jgi:hypothetical protein
MAVDFNKLQRELSETEMALLMGVGLAMFSAIEAGASTPNLIARIAQHEKNFTALRQTRAAEIMAALSAMMASTTPPR